MANHTNLTLGLFSFLCISCNLIINLQKQKIFYIRTTSLNQQS